MLSLFYASASGDGQDKDRHQGWVTATGGVRENLRNVAREAGCNICRNIISVGVPVVEVEGGI